MINPLKSGLSVFDSSKFDTYESAAIALGKLVLDYRNLIFSVAMRFAKNQTDADDLYSECLLKVLKALYGSFNDKGPLIIKFPKAYFSTVVRNTFLNSVQKEKQEVGEEKETQENEDLQEQLEAREELEIKNTKYHMCLDDLQGRERFVFESRLNNESYGWIAETLIPPIKEINARRIMSRARIKMTMCMSDNN